MGILSALQKLSEDVNEAADTIGKSTITDYGEPVYSLYTALDIRDIHRRIDITDELGNVKYYTKSSFIQIKGKTDIMDAGGNVIAHLEKKPISLKTPNAMSRMPVAMPIAAALRSGRTMRKMPAAASTAETDRYPVLAVFIGNTERTGWVIFSLPFLCLHHYHIPKCFLLQRTPVQPMSVF